MAKRSGPQPARRRIAVAAVLSAMMLVVLDAAMATVALPSIAQSLEVTPATSVLVVTSYQMALVMALLTCAALGESRGYRRVFTVGLAVFISGSMLCVISPSLPWLVAARFLQGLGGAGIMALGVALLRAIVPPGQFGAAIGWNALVVALASAAGPTLGSLILSAAPWPWLFAMNLPIGLLVLLASRALPRLPGSARRLDVISVVLTAGVSATFIIGAEGLVTAPLPSAALLVGSATGLWLLVRRELPKKAPLIPFDLLRIGSLRLSVIASVCCFAGQTAAMIALPFHLHHGFGLKTMMTGLCLTSWPVTVALAAPIAGRLTTCVSTAWLCTIGAACLTAGLAATSLWPLDGGPLPLIACAALCGLGFGLFNVPNNHNLFLSAPGERSGAAGGMQGTARLVGQTAGAVMITLLFTLTSIETAPRTGFAIAAMLTFLAGCISLLRVEPRA